MDGTQTLDRSHDLCFSPDDDEATGKGWYIQRFPEQDTSQLFPTKNKATLAWRRGELIFD